MKVTIKEFNIQMELGKGKSIEFGIHDTEGRHLGDFVLGKRYVEWCNGHTHAGNGVKVKWEQLIEYYMADYFSILKRLGRMRNQRKNKISFPLDHDRYHIIRMDLTLKNKPLRHVRRQRSLFQ
jgi:hypothetical protein